MNMQWPDTSMYGFRLGVMEWLRENDEPRYRMFVYPAMEDRPISPVFEERFARLGFTRNESNGVWSIDPGAVTRGAIAEAFPRTVVRAYDRSQIVFTVGSVQPSAPVTEAQPSPSPPAGDVSDERTAEDDTDSRAAGDESAGAGNLPDAARTGTDADETLADGGAEPVSGSPEPGPAGTDAAGGAGGSSGDGGGAAPGDSLEQPADERPADGANDASGVGAADGGGTGGEPVPDTDGGAAGVAEKRTGPEPVNFRLGDLLDTTFAERFSPEERFHANMDAIRILARREVTPEAPLSEDEQKTLATYVGWGGLADALSGFHYRFRNLRDQFNQAVADGLVTEDDRAGFLESTLNAHYTSPAVVRGVWSALERMGFSGGRALEPAAGTGNFIGLMPEALQETTRFTAVEMERFSGRIARALYPRADVQIRPFERYTAPNAHFDVVVGNVPFGNFRVHDPNYTNPKMNIHNYFIVRSLDLAREGGLVALLTSTYTMDARSTHARRMMAERGELLGALRLPLGAFSNNANTEVDIDILLFQKKSRPELRGQPLSELPLWVQGSRALEDDSDSETRTEKARVANPYFTEHPEHIIGELRLTSTRHGLRQMPFLDNLEELPQRLDAAIQTLPKGLFEARRKAVEEVPEIERTETSVTGRVLPNQYMIDPESDRVCLVESVDDQMTATLVPVDKLGKKAEARIRAYIEVRDALMDTIDAQVVAETDSPEYLMARERLNTTYDTFVKQYGPINQRANRLGLREDTRFEPVAAIEAFDGETATKTSIFNARVVKVPHMPERAESLEEALKLSLSFHGRIVPGRINQLMGKDPSDEQAWDAFTEQLRDRIYLNPETRDWETADVYLSGNVVRKLKIAQGAQGLDERDQQRMERNVQALQAVVPTPLRSDEISVQFGVPWIPESDVRNFVHSLFPGMQDHLACHYSPEANKWSIKMDKRARHAFTTAARQLSEEWSTEAVSLPNLLQHGLNGTRPVVTREDPNRVDDNGKPIRVTDVEATMVAQNKVILLEQRFANWVWEDPERKQRLLDYYNENLNGDVRMTPDGSHLDFPGMNPTIALRPHQKNGAWFALTRGNALFAHEVGTGKTYSMIATLIEANRIGRISRPFMMVKRNTLGQITQAARELYPMANVITLDSDNMSAKKREKFLSKLATSDFDLAIMSYEAFERIPLNIEDERRMMRERVEYLRSALDAAHEQEGGKSFSVKEIQKKLKRLSLKLQKLMEASPRDNVVTIDQLRPGAFCFDESQMLKNLDVNSSDRSFQQDGSGRANTAMMKVEWLRHSLGDKAMVLFATGTPVSNSFAEAHGLFRFLAPKKLDRMTGNRHEFDPFNALFIRNHPVIEIGVDGQYKERPRPAVINVPELVRSMSEFMDVRFTEDLNIQRPDAVREVITVESNEIQEVFRYEIADRAQAIRDKQVEPHEDNYLKIASDGRKAALDVRLIDPELPDFENSKTNRMVEKVAEKYHELTPVRGTQSIFCDLGVPSKKSKERGFVLYDDIRDKLIARGVPPEHIAYAHDATNDEERTILFDRVREGDIRIIIGSTEKMGTGTNMQDRMKCMHHLDPPSNMRPSDIEQREGRIERQGNQNADVTIYRYTTKDSFDLFVWQLMEAKRKVIRAIMRGDDSHREFSESDDSASYESLLAVSTGNTAMIHKIEVEREMKLLKAEVSEHERTLARSRMDIEVAEKNLASLNRARDAKQFIKDWVVQWHEDHPEAAPLHTTDPDGDPEPTSTSKPETASKDDLFAPGNAPEASPKSTAVAADSEANEDESGSATDADKPKRKPAPASPWCDPEGNPIPVNKVSTWFRDVRAAAREKDKQVSAYSHVRSLTEHRLTYYGLPVTMELYRGGVENKIHERLSIDHVVEMPDGRRKTLSLDQPAVHKLVKAFTELDSDLHVIDASIERQNERIDQARTNLDAPFDGHERLAQAMTRMTQVMEEVERANEAFQREREAQGGAVSIEGWKRQNPDRLNARGMGNVTQAEDILENTNGSIIVADAPARMAR